MTFVVVSVEWDESLQVGIRGPILADLPQRARRSTLRYSHSPRPRIRLSTGMGAVTLKGDPVDLNVDRLLDVLTEHEGEDGHG